MVIELLPVGFDLIMGIDCNNENEHEFINICEKKAKETVFKRLMLPAHIDMHQGISTLFHLPILSTFSLMPYLR
jgi:hypothetical protein